MYYCTSCEKHHPDKWKVHLKYKKIRKPILEVLGEDPVEIEFDEAHKIIEEKLNLTDEVNQSQQNRFQELDEKIAKVEKELSTVILILIHWKGFMDRKHPYSHAYQNLFEDLEK